MQRSMILPLTNVHHERDSLEDHPLFTPDLEYFTPSTNISLDNTNAYKSHTLTPYNMERQTILPVFPPSPFLTNADDHQSILLLSNVPSMIYTFNIRKINLLIFSLH